MSSNYLMLRAMGVALTLLIATALLAVFFVAPWLDEITAGPIHMIGEPIK